MFQTRTEAPPRNSRRCRVEAFLVSLLRSLPLVHDPRPAPIVPSLNRSDRFLSPFCPWIIFTGEDGGATNKEPSQQASLSVAAAATAAATTTVLALVAGLIAALRMKYMSADRRSGSSEGVANTTKADKLGTIKVRVEVDVLRASNATNMRFHNELLLFSLSLSLDFF